MPQLSDRDLGRISGFLCDLHGCHREEEFPRLVIEGVHRLIGACQTTWNLTGPNGVVVMATPEADPQHDLRVASLAALMGDHPVVRHLGETGDTSAHKISDFLSVREFHHSQLYQDLYRSLGYEDQLTVFLSNRISISLGRERRSFTERDRAVFNLLRPHIKSAYRHAAALSRMYQRMEWESLQDGVPRHASIQADAQGKIVKASATASRWLKEYFPLPRSPGRLPEELAVRLGATSGVNPLVRVQRPHTCLTVYADRDSMNGDTRLVLEKRFIRDPVAATLTNRERTILDCVADGLQNKQIATALDISELTVKKHLQHIFQKLGVNNRTAAIRRLQRET